MNTDDSKEGYIPWSCDACGSPCKKSLGPEGYCDTCRPIMLNGGNTPERVEEQIEWLKKVAEQKEINKVLDQVESAAVKAAHKVMEQHSEAFEKLAEKRMTNEIKELKKEIIRLKSLCRRAADEIRDLDNIIIDFVEGNAFPQKNEDDLWAGESSINLLNRLDGRTKGSYVENYEDLLSEMKAIDGG
jgi:hypothetical protein